MTQKYYEITTSDLYSVVNVKSKVEIWQNFVAFSEHMNFTLQNHFLALLHKILC